DLLKPVKNLARKFFELPYEEKLNIKMAADSGYRGYQRIGEDITKGEPDVHEAIDCYKEVEPGMYGDLEKPMVRFCFSVPSNASALSGSPYEFEGDRAGDAFWVMRLIGYPASRGLGKSINPGLLNCCITGLLKLVSQDDDITALQVRNRSDEWISAPPVLGTFVCNIGDMLKIYSNGLYESTLHQVINSSTKYRVCVAYLYEE
ncbi:hypothetical protein C1H46_043812, partial [Malus baccata]